MSLTNQIEEVPGSFRDPDGQVFIYKGNIYRAISETASQDFYRVSETDFYKSNLGHKIVATKKCTPPEIKSEFIKDNSVFLQHERIPLITYPYEWCFEALKAAALLHLDLQLQALKDDVSFSDATAYNIQFIGAEPVFIDILSFKSYRNGEYWKGYKQFCEQFVNPLLLASELGIAHNCWYRGQMEGIPSSDLFRVLPLRSKIKPNILTHVSLQGKYHTTSLDDLAKAKSKLSQEFPKSKYRTILLSLQGWIKNLKNNMPFDTTWSEYAESNTYADTETVSKHRFIEEFVSKTKPKCIWDLGCNTGNFSKTALAAGALTAIGFDFDHAAVNKAFLRSQNEKLNFLPLWLDAMNPSPSLGWRQTERDGFYQRADADAVLALAFEHHLCIARNVPVNQFVDWLVGLAPTGIVEFVPKEDETVQILLTLREDIFRDYTLENFISSMNRCCRIIKTEAISKSGRTLIWYEGDAQ